MTGIEYMCRGYQFGFSEKHFAAVHDREGRRKKAKTMVAVLRDFFKSDMHSFSLLDVGSSTGIIDDFLSEHVASVSGIDIDTRAVAFANSNFKKNNLRFVTGDAMNMPFPSSVFDIVICSQVYEHVPSAEKLMAEIERVLRRGGVCFFAAGNRLDIMERHYNLPFLSVLPRPLAHLYLRITGRGTRYYEKHLSYWSLKKLVRRFKVTDYTERVICDPSRFFAGYMLRAGTLKAGAAVFIARHFLWLCPGYIWLLQKK